MAAAVAVAILLATAALVVGIVDLTRSPARVATGSSAPSTSTPAASADFLNGNRALCAAIAPLMAESDRIAKAYTSLGPAGTPSWNTGAQQFIRDTKDWAGRIQPIIDNHQDAEPFLHRSLQRFVDDQRLLALDLEAGPYQPYDQTIWNDSLAADNGPLSICWGLGVKW